MAANMPLVMLIACALASGISTTAYAMATTDRLPHKCPQDVKPVAGNRVPFAADRFSPHQKDRDDGKEPGAITEKGDLDRCDRSVQKFWNREHDGEQ